MTKDCLTHNVQFDMFFQSLMNNYVRCKRKKTKSQDQNENQKKNNHKHWNRDFDQKWN